MINEFIEKIIVHAQKRLTGIGCRRLRFIWKFIGRFELPEPDLTPEEIKQQEQPSDTASEPGTLPKNQGW